MEKVKSSEQNWPLAHAEITADPSRPLRHYLSLEGGAAC